MSVIKAIVIFIFTSYVSCKRNGNLGIIGGHRISIKEVPFIVSLRRDGIDHWCGGSIIHERFILTAAHCIETNRTYNVLVGTENIDKGGVIYDVEKILVHENYSNRTHDYDICLIKLNENLTFGPKVNKIELGDTSTRITRGVLWNATGWGFTDPKGPISSYLLQVKIPYVPRLFCSLSYLKRLNITPRMICAGGNGRDSCMGDSGGPLTWNNIQIGVTSCGAGCGVLPGIYTKVSVMRDWIDNTIQKNL